MPQPLVQDENRERESSMETGRVLQRGAEKDIESTPVADLRLELVKKRTVSRGRAVLILANMGVLRHRV